MRASFKNLLLTAIVALIAGFAGIWLGQSALISQRQPKSMHELIHSELKLTGAQEAQIEDLEKDFAQRRVSYETEMRAANAALAAAINEEHGFGPHVTAAVERFHASMGGLQTETIQHVFAMRKVLTAEQKTVFDQHVITALTAEQQ